ncbi:MAG: universal stress protein [Hyphomicrobiaceae bacterium]|nr:universal stress protein [Hyphomicrobiaceae bacterium]
MFKKILIAVDLSAAEKGKLMIDTAGEVGGKSAHLTLINVVEDIPAYVAYELPQGILETTRDNAQNQLDDMANVSGRKIATEVRSGNPATAILDAAEEIGADLIIIASHRPGLQDYLLGSTAGRVVRHAKCSVLVLR